MEKEKYSVLMSVYYKEKPDWLKTSIQSILNQTMQTNDFVIVKDGPIGIELETVIDEYINNYPELFNIISLPKNVGLGMALAEGIKHCKNSLIARMDSDDICTIDRCAKELECFQKNKNLKIVGCFEAEFVGSINDVKAIHKVPETHKEIAAFMRRRCALLHPTVMFRKEAVLEIGNYRSVKLYEDYDLFARLVFGGYESYNIQEVLYYIRINPEFYMRRGGVEYLKTVVKFKNYMRKKGYMSVLDFIISAGGQAAVCLMPNKLREWFYMTFLR
ncbi:glycosyltransferase [Clostridium polynesiense]|uniref:glycosyltransferase n=1 Tax=Clostridium polynesiense TaxID=1325933 RepID=UPI00058F8A19|nr:glycosyltransferase [Clostridium polynesiense]